MKLKVVCRKVFNCIRYDLKEIAFPFSLPDPPHIKKHPKLAWKERYLVLKEASRLYAASWVRDIGPELRPNDYKMKEEGEETFNGEKGAPKEREPSTLEDLAVAARGGMETLKPALQRVYMTRASAYRDTLRSFIEGYQEGIQQVMETKEEGKFQQGEGRPKNTNFMDSIRINTESTDLDCSWFTRKHFSCCFSKLFISCLSSSIYCLDRFVNY